MSTRIDTIRPFSYYACMNNFAMRLRGLIESAGITPYEVSKRAGVSRQLVSKLLLNKGQPNWETVQKLAFALGVDCTAFADTGATKAKPAKRGRQRKQK
jgi:transcriptional regulator with XRE-family HTH domain